MIMFQRNSLISVMRRARIGTALLFFVTLAAEGIGAEEAPAGGISTEFGDVMIENLGIGQTYSLRELAGTPLKVTNTGRGTMDLAIDVHVPPPGFMPEKRKNLGFVPIPDAKWVSLTQSEFVVPPKETAYTDVILKIPNDPSLYGKKFQVSLQSHATGKGFLHVGVWSHILFTILPSPEMQAEMEKNRTRGLKSVAFSLIPDKIYIEKVPVGRKFDIRKETKQTIKIATSGEESINVTAKVVRVQDSPLSLQEGFEDAPNASWLSTSDTKFTLNPDMITDPGLVLNLPDDKTLHKRKFMFLLKIDPAEEDAISVSYYGKIYVEVE